MPRSYLKERIDTIQNLSSQHLTPFPEIFYLYIYLHYILPLGHHTLLPLT
jgi:hypothetical protein